MFPIDSLKENVFFYFRYAASGNTMLSITAKPMHRTSVVDYSAAVACIAFQRKNYHQQSEVYRLIATVQFQL